MSWLLIAIAAVLLILADRYWGPYALRKLRVGAECDQILTEPGQVVTLHTRVENHSRLPVPFIRLKMIFELDVSILGEERWLRRHCTRGIQLQTVEERLSLMPLRSAMWDLRFTCKHRGPVRVGRARLSAGDLLGFRETVEEHPHTTVVVMPDRSRDRQALEAVGGFLGDISVRRFILEDPVLTVGFRDYTGREPLKSISWTRTAVTGTMQVKQYDHTAEQTVMVLLNVSGAKKEELEACFRLTRSVCETLERRKIPFGLRTNGNLSTPTGKLFHLAEGLGTSHLNAVLYGLGMADDTCYRGFASLVKQALKGRRNQEAYIVITPPPDAAAHAAIRELEKGSNSPVCVIVGREQEATE